MYVIDMVLDKIDRSLKKAKSMNDNVILDKILTTKYWNKKILKEI